MRHGSGAAPNPCGRTGPLASAVAPFDLLRVSMTDGAPGVLVVAPVGEVDVSTAGLLRDAVGAAVAAAPRCLAIDLDGISFCGSTGLLVLVEARRRAEAAGMSFAVVGGSAIVRRVLEITALGPSLGHRETLEDVVRELTEPPTG